MLISENNKQELLGFYSLAHMACHLFFIHFFLRFLSSYCFFFLLLTKCAKIALYERIQNEMGCNEFYANAAHTLTQI